MDAIRKIEAALAALPANADSPWTNLDKMPYIHKTDDKNASPWSCAVVGRFDYLPTMDYMLACQPSAIREVLQTLASKEAEVARLRRAVETAIAYLAPRLANQPESHGSTGVLPELRAALTTQPKE